MKFTDVTDERQRQAQIDYINTYWRALAETENSCLSTLLGFGFALNAGGLAAGLAYVATRETSSCMLFAIALAAFGTLLLIIRNAVEYFFITKESRDFRRELSKYYAGTNYWQDIQNITTKPRPLQNYGLAILGLLSFLAAFAAIAIAIVDLYGSAPISAPF